MPQKSSPGAAERRAAVRHHPARRKQDCEVEAAEKEERWPATIQDVSRSGMGLVVDRPFEAGTLLEVELEAAKGRAAMVLSMRVVHVHRHEDAWLLGCLLETALDPEQLAHLAGRQAVEPNGKRTSAPGSPHGR